MGYASIVADITNSKRKPDSRQLVVRQCTALVCKLLVMARVVQFNGLVHHLENSHEELPECNCSGNSWVCYKDPQGQQDSGRKYLNVAQSGEVATAEVQ